MILVYKLVKDERSGDVVPKVVGDLPDESALANLGPGTYALFVASQTMADVTACEIPSRFQFNRIVTITLEAPKLTIA